MDTKSSVNNKNRTPDVPVSPTNVRTCNDPLIAATNPTTNDADVVSTDPESGSNISIEIKYLVTQTSDDCDDDIYSTESDNSAISADGNEDPEHLEDAELSSTESNAIDDSDIDPEPPPKPNRVRFHLERNTASVNAKFPKLKGGQINHKSINLCPCHHCYVLNVPSLFREVTIDVAAVSHDAKPGEETFDLPEIPMMLTRQDATDNFLNNNNLVQDLDGSNEDEVRLWNLYENLDTFVEDWGDQLRGFNCWDSLCNVISTGVSWTFGKLCTLWRIFRTCRQVAPAQEHVPLEDLNVEERDSRQLNLRRTNSCDF